MRWVDAISGAVLYTLITLLVGWFVLMMSVNLYKIGERDDCREDGGRWQFESELAIDLGHCKHRINR